ncbi:MAG TPA: hypothetical protein VLH75_08160 [Longimicrobiales bacterium]|nr:hypothetical protein [Longimicrobiales bacterium]
MEVSRGVPALALAGLLALMPGGGLAALQAPPDRNCGAEDVPRIGLIVSYVKHLPDGHTEEGPGTEVGRWGSGFIPDVSLGPQPVGFNLVYEDGRGGDHYVRMVVRIEENYMQFVTGLEGNPFGTRDDVGATITVVRKGLDGQYVQVSEQHEWVGSLAEIDGLRPFVQAEIEGLHHFLIEKLLPTKVSFKLSWHVHDVEDPVAPIFFIDAMEDSFGPIEPHPTERNFCFNVHLTHYDGTELASTVAVDEKKFWRYDLQEDIRPHVEKACEPREGYCERPEASVQPYLTKAFGTYWDDRLETFDSDDRPITFVCPLDVAPPSPDTLFLGAPERRALPFKVTGLDGMPLPGVDVEVTRGVAPEMGAVAPQRMRTASTGEPEGLAITTREDAPPDAADQVEVAVCRDTPADKLGKDESGRPIPWTDTAVQTVKVQVFPTVEVTVRAVHELDRSEDKRVESPTQVSRELTRTDTDQELDLSFQVVLGEREVKRDYRDGSGFRGTLIQYRGNAEARVALASLEPSKETVQNSGYYQDRDCGRLSFDFLPWTNTYTFRQLSDRASLLVLYQHFIPDAASPVQRHPREGLSYVQRTPAPVVTFTPRSIDVTMEQDGCRLDYETMRAPAMQVPLQLNEAFPILFGLYMDDCYGLEAVTVPLKEEDSMGALLRKWDPVTRKFDELEHTVTVNLGRNDTAECWSIPADTRTERYIPDGTRVKGLWSLSSQARLVGGNFDFRPDPPR